jgi:hypothetical protein
MQFVVVMELFGTVVLPAAVVCTFYLIISTIIAPVIEWIPIVLLIVIMGIPAVLVIIVSDQPLQNVVWVAPYLLALPIWNFVLPVGESFVRESWKRMETSIRKKCATGRYEPIGALVKAC